MVGNYGYLGDIEAQTKLICDTLRPSNTIEARKLLLETAAAETGLGNVWDNTIYAGMGLCQFDKAPFYRVRDKSVKYRQLIIDKLGIDINLVEWEGLRYNPFLSLLFCRLYYMLIAEPIPSTIEARAAYWKKWYNSALGKGTPKHYLSMNYKWNNEDKRYIA